MIISREPHTILKLPTGRRQAERRSSGDRDILIEDGINQKDGGQEKVARRGSHTIHQDGQ